MCVQRCIPRACSCNTSAVWGTLGRTSGFLPLCDECECGSERGALSCVSTRLSLRSHFAGAALSKQCCLPSWWVLRQRGCDCSSVLTTKAGFDFASVFSFFFFFLAVIYSSRPAIPLCRAKNKSCCSWRRGIRTVFCSADRRSRCSSSSVDAVFAGRCTSVSMCARHAAAALLSPWGL